MKFKEIRKLFKSGADSEMRFVIRVYDHGLNTVEKISSYDIYRLYGEYSVRKISLIKDIREIEEVVLAIDLDKPIVEYEAETIGELGIARGSLVYSPSENQYYIIEHNDEELSFPIDVRTLKKISE